MSGRRIRGIRRVTPGRRTESLARGNKGRIADPGGGILVV